VDANGAYVANTNAGLSLLGLATTGDVVQISGPSTSPTYSTYYNGVTNLLNITVLNGIPNVSQVTNGTPGFVWISGDTLSCAVTLSILCGGLNVQKLNDVPGGGTDFPAALLFSTPAAATRSWPSSGNPYTCLLALLGCGSIEQPEGLAIDNSGRAWVAVQAQTSAITSTTGVDELALVTQSGSVTGRYTGGGISTPFGVSIDGSGNVFVANSSSSAGSVSEFTSAGLPVSSSIGFGGASVAGPTNLDIDESGDVWVVSPGSNGYVTEFIGIATPVVRPLAAASASSKLGSAP
jgi:hypothetical protein